MVRRAKVQTGDVFLTADAVATRLAIKELKRAKIDPRPLLAKAGISLLKLGEEPKRVGAESQIRFGTPRRFAAVRRFGRDRSEADMPRASGAGDLTKMTHLRHSQLILLWCTTDLMMW
jgi:hypothetical protein